MTLRRGDIVVVSVAGDYGKPRPAIVMQTDAMPPRHASVVLCQLTSTIVDDLEFRVIIDPSPTNGLRLRSQAMADKPVTLARSRIGQAIGHVGLQDLARVTAAMAFVIGVSE